VGALPRPFVGLGAYAPSAPAGSGLPAPAIGVSGLDNHVRPCGAQIGSRSRSGITSQTLCCLDVSVFAAAVSPRKPKTQRGGPRRTLAGGAGNMAPRKPNRASWRPAPDACGRRRQPRAAKTRCRMRGDLFPRLQFVFPQPARLGSRMGSPRGASHRRPFAWLRVTLSFVSC